jgi:hypothetical protein
VNAAPLPRWWRRGGGSPYGGPRGTARDRRGGEWEEWGLSAPQLKAMRDELDDHVLCLRGEEGPGIAAVVEGKLAEPRTRRKLAAPHLADQVYATLNRWPTRREWIELAVLLAWFAVIVLSDWLAWYAHGLLLKYDMYFTETHHPSLREQAVQFTAWLLQAAARGGFFASFASSIVRSWRIGAGVCLARVLQLKLLHTILVVSACILLGPKLEFGYFFGHGLVCDIPPWLTTFVISGSLLLVSLVVLFSSRLRAWSLASGLALCALFLFPGGPLPVFQVDVTRPIAVKTRVQVDGSTVLVPDNDRQKIRAAAAHFQEHQLSKVDVEKNLYHRMRELLAPVTACYLDRGLLYPNFLDNTRPMSAVEQCHYGPQVWLAGPEVAAGGGLGWLAVPIPLLGVVGFAGLLGLMGRRSVGDLLLYTVLCVAGLVTTGMPFFAGSGLNSVSPFETGPLALMISPFIGFESLLADGFVWDTMWLTLVGGLLFSAAVPWVLTALFLKPRAAGANHQRGRREEECA